MSEEIELETEGLDLTSSLDTSRGKYYQTMGELSPLDTKEKNESNGGSNKNEDSDDDLESDFEALLIKNQKNFYDGPTSGKSHHITHMMKENTTKLKLHTREEFDDTKHLSQHVWSSLPDSINGTLIYFLLVEQNRKYFDIGEFAQCIFFTGIPVYLVFYIQALLIYWIWVISPDFESSPICQTDPYLEHAVICIFFIFMYPSVKSIICEAYVVLRATRVGFTHEEIDDKILLYSLHSPMSKRLTIFFMIVFPETCILSSLYFVGSKFM